MRVCCAGDNVVDCYPDLGLMYPGGNAVNVAVGARRAGCESAYVGAVGADVPGRVIVDALIAEGVGTERLRIVDGPTAYAVVQLVEGERVFVDSDLGVSEIVLDQDDLAYAATFDLVHSGDCSGLETQLPALAAAVPVSFDFSHRPAEYCAPLLPHVEIASFSAGHLDDAAIEKLLRDATAAGPRVALATAGSRGAMLLIDRRVYHAPAVAAPTVVDTLGAGDTFIARILVGILCEETPATMLRAASELAAETIGESGAFGHPASLELPLLPTVRRLS
jgi:fructoselysine 6-kinase